MQTETLSINEPFVEVVTEDKMAKRKSGETPDVIMTCNSCHHETGKGKGTLKCANCSKFTHYECTRLPPYIIYTFTSSKRQYICELCAGVPEDFLRSIIDRSIIGTTESTPVLSNLNATFNETIELKVNDIHDYNEKYDLRNIIQNLTSINNLITENLSKLEKNSMNRETSNTEKEIKTVIMDEELKARLDESLSETRSLKAAEKLLMETIAEKGKKIDSLYEEKEKYSKTIIEQQKEIFSLKQSLGEVDVRESSSCGLIDALKQQIREYSARVENLEGKLEKLIEEKTVLTNEISTSRQLMVSSFPSTSQPNFTAPKPKIILMHDSICGPITEGICSKENIITKKVWAPHLINVQEEIENLEENVDVIAIHAMTNDLKHKEVDELVNKLSDVVDQSLEKANKVVISTIINRHDDPVLSAKASAINANTKLKYLK